jgi:hypothetical protein
MDLNRTLRPVLPGFLLLLVAFGAPAADETPSDHEQEVREGIRVHDAGDHAGAIAIYERIRRRTRSTCATACTRGGRRVG